MAWADSMAARIAVSSALLFVFWPSVIPTGLVNSLGLGLPLCRTAAQAALVLVFPGLIGSVAPSVAMTIHSLSSKMIVRWAPLSLGRAWFSLASCGDRLFWDDDQWLFMHGM